MAAVLVLIMALFSAVNAHADIYKKVSDEGVVVFSNAFSGPSSKIVAREKDPVPVYAGTGAVYSEENFRAAVEEKARQHNVDPRLVNAIIRAESNWNPGAVSPKGALGLMQLMPSTAAVLGVSNPFDPLENIDGGVRYISHLIERFNGNLVLALAAYNAGPALIEKKGAVPSIPETVSYVKRVMKYYNNGSGMVMNVNTQAIQREVKKEFVRMKKVVLEDGTLLFTNTPGSIAKSY